MRKKDQINSYNRNYKKGIVRGHPSDNKYLMDFLKRHPSCQKCGISINIQVCHIKPRKKGGRHKDNLITLCQKHHYLFDQLLVPFWKDDV